MEKGQESKQKRKTPLTTIAISQEYAQKLDEYLKGTGITRKEFVSCPLIISKEPGSTSGVKHLTSPH
jgi:hypothetical protein